MKKIIILIIISEILFSACKNQDEKIIIIDKLPLGTNIDTLNNEFNKRELYDSFTTSLFITDLEELKNKKNQFLLIIQMLLLYFQIKTEKILDYIIQLHYQEQKM